MPVPSRIPTLVTQSAGFYLGLLAAGACGGVVTDGSFGAAGAINRIGGDYAVPHTLGKKVGGNLFHSFSQFDLQSAESATFTGPADVTNILSRVTGGSNSYINGTIRSQIPGANFFLVNPRGILFGPSGQVEVSGAFVATTANYLRLSDNRRFTAAPGRDDLTLTSAPVTAYGFLGNQPAAIGLFGTFLASGDTTDIALIAGDIDVFGNSTVFTINGGVYVASVASAGEVKLDLRATSPVLDTAGLARLGSVNLNLSTLQGGSRFLGTSTGRVVIRGGRLTMAGSNIINDAGTHPRGDGVDIVLSEAISLEGENVVASTSTSDVQGRTLVRISAPEIALLGSSIFTFGRHATGQSGGLSITANRLTLDQDSLVGATNEGGGGVGNITIDTESLTIRGASGIFSGTESDFPSGNISVRTGTLTIRDGTIGTLSGDGGQAGDVNVEVRGAAEIRGISAIGTTTLSSGNGGALDFHAASLAMDAPRVEQGGESRGITNQTGGSGAAGPIRLRIDGPLRILGGARVDSTTFGPGRGGTIDVRAGSIDLAEGGGISSVSQNTGRGGESGAIFVQTERLNIGPNSSIDSSTLGLGAGGGVRIEAGHVAISGPGSMLTSGISSFSFNPGAGGPAGDIEVTVRETLRIRDGGLIGGDTLGLGKGGDIRIQAGQLDIVGFGDTKILGTGISASSRSTAAGGDAGDVQVTIAGAISLRNGGAIGNITRGGGKSGEIIVQASSAIFDGGGTRNFTGLSAQAGGKLPEGRGGSISLQVTGRLELRDGGAVSSSTFGPAPSGDATVEAGEIFVSAARARIFTGITASSSDAQSSGGAAGSVTVNVARRLELRDGGVLTVETVGGGDAGQLRVAAGDILIAGANIVDGRAFKSGISATTEARGAGGRAGSINVRAGTVTLRTDGVITSESFNASSSGVIAIGARSVTLEGGAVTSTNMGSGAAGGIRLNLSNTLSLNKNSTLATTAVSGLAGEIDVRAEGGVRLTGSTITVRSLSGDAGSITLRTPGGLVLADSAIVAEAGGSGGNITIDAASLALDGSRITANAVAGDGGLITLNIPANGVLGGPEDFVIVSPFVTQSGDSRISASSEQGVQGALLIGAPEVDLSNALEGFNAALLDVSTQLREVCGMRFGGIAEFSSFLVLGRGGVAASPEEIAGAPETRRRPRAAR